MSGDFGRPQVVVDRVDKVLLAWQTGNQADGGVWGCCCLPDYAQSGQRCDEQLPMQLYMSAAAGAVTEVS